MLKIAEYGLLFALSSSAFAVDGSFSALGSGVNGPVFSMAAIGTDIYVGGAFSDAGGVSVRNLARWDGALWHAVGAGTNAEVEAITQVGSVLYIGGSFTEAGGVTANHIARWDGTQFQSIGSGAQNGVDGIVRSLASDGSALYVGGVFLNAGGQPALHVARLEANGSTWSSIVGTNNVVQRLVFANGSVLLGGYFGIAGGVTTSTVARYSGSAWSGFPFGMLAPAGVAWTSGLLVQGNEVYAGGYFDRVGGPQPGNPVITTANYIARWDGSQWTTLGSGGQVGMNNVVYDVTLFAGELIAAGGFTMAGATPASFIARRAGGVWQAMGAGLNAPPAVLLATPGALFIGGEFTQAGAVTANHIARWTTDTAFIGGFEPL